MINLDENFFDLKERLKTKKIKYSHLSKTIIVDFFFLEINDKEKNKNIKKKEKLINFLFNFFGYFLRYLEFPMPEELPNIITKKEIVVEYLQLAFSEPLLWRKEENFLFFLQNPAFFRHIDNQKKNQTISFCISINKCFNWKIPVKELKRILNLLGLTTNLSFHAYEKNNCQTEGQNKKLVLWTDFSDLNKMEKKDLLIEKLKTEKIYELSGVHTNFSTLDGISSPADYINEAKKKNYKNLAVTDHFNIQSFPKFYELEKEEIEIIYGCELELLEDDFPLFFFNDKKNEKEKKIEELTYFFFDLETTGFFSEYNEIVEIGYVICYKETILESQNFLVKPEKTFTTEYLKNWFHKTITPEELLKAPKISTILEKIKKKLEEIECVLVAHNAINFDYGFLNKAWKKQFNQEFPYPIIDTLPLSWLVFPEQKSYSLKQLSSVTEQKKVEQKHRALADSLLLNKLFLKIVNELKKNDISTWKEANILIERLEKKNNNKRGKKIKVLVQNQEGLYNLYRLITISHTEKFTKRPVIFRSDLLKHRKGLYVGSSGNTEGEIFFLFSTFNSETKRTQSCKFYDYIEIPSPHSLSHLHKNGFLEQKNLEDMIKKMISCAKQTNVLTIINNNVHYAEKKEKILKDIIVANEGMSGERHYFYWIATNEEKEDRFSIIPFQHLLSKEELVEQWCFLTNIEIVEDLILNHPKKLLKKIEKVKIKFPPLNYSNKIEEKIKELEEFFFQETNSLFGKNWPEFVKERIEKEWNIIKKKYAFIFWIAWKIAKKSHEEGFLIGSRGSVGCSFIAFLCKITELNPLPFYKHCNKCLYSKLHETEEVNFCCYDYKEKEVCPRCFSDMTMEGFNLPMETFFGIAGEKTPDIDLNFSGECQKIIHNYVRTLLGSDSVHRIGTVNSLKTTLSELFWDKHLELRKTLNNPKNINKILDETPEWQKKYKKELLNKKFSEEEWYKEWKNESKTKQEIKEEILNKLNGIKRTTGQHPGGLLITPPGVDIKQFTPLNYPADRQTEFTTTHFEYDFLSKMLLKVDILGYDGSTVLQKLFQLTKKDPLTISCNDEKVMNLFNKADTLGITEFGTDFVKKILIFLKPTKFAHLIQISGFSHGTEVWQNNQQNILKKKQLTLDQLIACRDDIWNLFIKRGLNTQDAFVATELIRKGKWDKIPENLIKTITDKFKNDEEGKIYLEILSKLIYIVPKPHAIAYTISAWRSAFYKQYFPKQFYSSLLTYYIVVYDIWLMTLDPKVVEFRLQKLLDNISVYKNSVKELSSIIKVLKKISEKKNDNEIADLEPILQNTYTKIEELNLILVYSRILWL